MWQKGKKAEKEAALPDEHEKGFDTWLDI